MTQAELADVAHDFVRVYDYRLTADRTEEALPVTTTVATVVDHSRGEYLPLAPK